ncbi:hypothetical protein PRZ48_013558 [Zasmidium cellare]|uniref:Uncharacterized protein n=1 Tax=Zasmidium cellare TaxID=395010 RepID=A0ABR0E1E9_ZASCE|nr:hypothetical protein PRZ48_013558 [Zasmidium cellare]
MARGPFEGLALNAAYGPLMSPAMFASRWVHKFCSFIFYRYLQGQIVKDALWMWNFVEAGLDYIVSFHAQAASHDLRLRDFPCSPSVPPYSSYGDLEDLKKHMTNPFTCVIQTTLLVDGFLQRLKSMKMQGYMIRGMPWQALPLEIRESLNTAFEEVERVRRLGMWEVSDKDRELMAAEFRKSEGGPFWYIPKR